MGNCKHLTSSYNFFSKEHVINKQFWLIKCLVTNSTCRRIRDSTEPFDHVHVYNTSMSCITLNCTVYYAYQWLSKLLYFHNVKSA